DAEGRGPAAPWGGENVVKAAGAAVPRRTARHRGDARLPPGVQGRDPRYLQRHAPRAAHLADDKRGGRPHAATREGPAGVIAPGDTVAGGRARHGGDLTHPGLV